MLGPAAAAALPAAITGQAVAVTAIEAVDVDAAARSVLAVVSTERATWTRWNAEAEAKRQLHPLRLPRREDRDALTAAVAAARPAPGLAIDLSPPALEPLPDQRSRADGEPVLVPHGAAATPLRRSCAPKPTCSTPPALPPRHAVPVRLV